MEAYTVLLSSGSTIDVIKNMDLWAQGLFVVIAGLIGVFIVLFLFFLTIVIMQKISEGAVRRKANK